jgi:hypothetical protein
MKIVRIDESGSCRIWNGDVFHGTTVMYAAAGDDSFGMQCDYELNTLEDFRKKEVRAYRTSLRRRGKKLEPLKDDQIQDELVVIFGPEMSARRAVETLTALAKKIEREGLLIGRDETDDYVVESAERVPRYSR